MKMESSSWIHSVVILLIASTGVRCLRNVSLEVIPEVVERGAPVTLRCHYILDDMKLYSLKWYRGKHEFYRFSPSENPSTKVFNIPGIQVDPTNSNHTQVTIVNVEFGLSGNFCCEVTADAPTFATEYGVKKLLVVSLPKGKPNITTERSRYDLGDMLKANCSVPTSRPPVEFVFKLNTIKIGPINATQLKSYSIENNAAHRDNSQLQYAEIGIYLKSNHFTHNNQLILRCIAQIPGGIYSNESEVNLSAPMGDPKSEKVTSSSNKIIASCAHMLETVLAFILLHPLLR